VRSATCRQTPSLATAARNCDQIAAKRRVTARDGCPTRAAEMAVDQDHRVREGIRRRGRGQVVADYGSGGWGFESLAALMQTVTGPDGTYHEGAARYQRPRCTTSSNGRRSGRSIGVSGRSAGVPNVAPGPDRIPRLHLDLPQTPPGPGWARRGARAPVTDVCTPRHSRSPASSTAWSTASLANSSPTMKPRSASPSPAKAGLPPRVAARRLARRCHSPCHSTCQYSALQDRTGWTTPRQVRAIIGRLRRCRR
jgi:hypothetical protein